VDVSEDILQDSKGRVFGLISHVCDMLNEDGSKAAKLRFIFAVEAGVVQGSNSLNDCGKVLI
jgi:hypothetical protein